MRSWKRILPYIVLNIIVSALTTLGVLWLWDRSLRASLPAQPAPAASPAAQGSQLPPTLPAINETVIQIQNVFGVGDLKSEVVRLKRLGEGELWLTGWTLEDEDGHRYVFPELRLNKDGAVEVYSRAGPDTVIELHWGLSEAVWRTGELVLLKDPQGNLRASYRIP